MLKSLKNYLKEDLRSISFVIMLVMFFGGAMFGLFTYWSRSESMMLAIIPFSLTLYCYSGLIYGVATYFYKGKNKYVIAGINSLMIPSSILFMFLFLIQFIMKPFVIMSMMFVFIAGISSILAHFEIITVEVMLFVSITLTVILASYFGNNILKYGVSILASTGNTEEETQKEYDNTIALFNQNLFKYLIYSLYFLTISLLTIIKLNNHSNSDELLFVEKILLPSFVVFICFERLVSNSHLTKASDKLFEKIRK